MKRTTPMPDPEALSYCYGQTYKIGLKLRALGVVLERQGADREGFTELEGLGVILTELGRKLRRVTLRLDERRISPHLERRKSV